MNTPQQDITNYTRKNIVVQVTMQELFSIIKMIQKHEVGPEHELDFWRLQEYYLHNHTIDGYFTYDVHNDGAWTVRKIKQYKPDPIQSEPHFVVEM